MRICHFVSPNDNAARITVHVLPKVILGTTFILWRGFCRRILMPEKWAAAFISPIYFFKFCNLSVFWNSQNVCRKN